MFQRVGPEAYRRDLHNIRELSAFLGNPNLKFPSVHIAGTNGKGSSSHLLASVLQEAGYHTGLTTSPHLKDFRERIRVNGRVCPETFVIEFVERVSDLTESLGASFFEVSIAMAFEYFAQEKVDIAIVETGLGGRLDSTNIINPLVSVITNIGLDHTQFLGDTLGKIAVEKAGIIKPGVPVVIGESHPETRKVFEAKAQKSKSEIVFAEEKKFEDYDSDLKGSYQFKNKRTVLAAIEFLQQKGFVILTENIQEGFLKVVPNTGLRGRWEVLGEKPLTVADTAHNLHGLMEVLKQILQTPYEKLHLVLGFVNDKDVASLVQMFPNDAVYYFSAPKVPRKLTVEKLRETVPAELDASYYTSVSAALKAAQSKASVKDFIFIGGSTFVVAEVVD